MVALGGDLDGLLGVEGVGVPGDSAIEAGGQRGDLERAAAVLQMATLAAADEPEIAALTRGGAEARLLDMRRTVTRLAARGLVRDGRPTAATVDHVWAATSPEVYLSFRARPGLDAGPLRALAAPP